MALTHTPTNCTCLEAYAGLYPPICPVHDLEGKRRMFDESANFGTEPRRIIQTPASKKDPNVYIGPVPGAIITESAAIKAARDEGYRAGVTDAIKLMGMK